MNPSYQRAGIMSLTTALLIYALSFTSGYSASLPAPTSSAYEGKSAKTLIELSFVGVNRTSTRTYLAEQRPDTIEGLFCKGWQYGDKGDWQNAVNTYTKVIEDPRTWPRLKTIAAGNRSYVANQGNVPNLLQIQQEAIEIAYAEGDLNAACNLTVEQKARPIWLKVHQKYPSLIKKHRAAFLLAEAKYHYYAKKDYKKTRSIVTELWNMDLDQWTGEFDFSRLLSFRLSKNVYGDLKINERLLGDNFRTKLLRLQQKTNNNVNDPVRRAIVAGWVRLYALKIHNLDTRHWGYSLAAFDTIHNLSGSNPTELYPSGDSMKAIMKLWDNPRDGTQLASRGERPRYQLEDLAKMTKTAPAHMDVAWYIQRAELLSRLGHWQDAARAYHSAAQGAYYPDDRIAVLASWGKHYLGPRKNDYSEVINDLSSLYDTASPDGKRKVTIHCFDFSYASGDMKNARDWINKFLTSKNASAKYGSERLAAINNIERLQRSQQQFKASNPIESKWQDQHGQSGVAVQLNFATNSAKLPADTERKIEPIIQALNDETYNNLVFRIEGHTDSKGTDAINEPLSLKRAKSLADYLEQNKAIPPSRIEIDGFGSRRPIASNLSESGRILNRRVELNLLGDASRPSLVATGTMVNGISTVSPDGRLMLSYNNDVWDTRSWVRLYSVPLSWKSKGAVFSPDGKYLFVATTADSASIGVLLDARTGVLVRLVKNLTAGKLMTNPAWSPDSKRIAYIAGSSCHVYNVATNRFDGSVSSPGSSGWGIYPSWIKGGDALALLGYAASGQMYLVDTRSWKVNKLSIPQLGWSHDMASSFDGRYLYISDDRGYILDWDTLQGGQPQVQPFWKNVLSKGTRFAAKRISVHPGNPRKVALDCMHSKHWGVVDFQSGRARADKSTNKRSPTPLWGADGHELLISGGWTANEQSRRAGAGTETGIYRLNLRDNQSISNNKLEFIKGVASNLWSVIAFEEQNLIVAFTSNDVSVWDVTNGRQVHRWPGKINSFVEASKTEQGVFYGVRELPEGEVKSVIYKYNLNDFTKRKLVDLGNFDVSSLDAGPGLIAVGGAEFTTHDYAREELTLRIVDGSTGKTLAEKTVPALTSTLKYGKMNSSGFDALALSPSGSELAYVTRWQDGYGYGSTVSKQVGRWNWKTDQNTPAINTSFDNGIDSILYDTDSRLRVSGSPNWNDSIYNLQTLEWGESLAKTSRPNHTCTTPLKDAFDDLNLKIEYSSRGEIRFLRRDTDSIVVTILKKGGEWIAYNTEGYFVASAGGTDKVFWRVGSRMLPLEALREKFENPALLADSMKSIFEKRVIKKANVIVRPKIDPDLFSIPYEVNVVSPSGIQTNNDSYTMKVEIKTLTNDAPEPNVVWTFNGHTGRGFKVVPAKVAPRIYHVTHEFKLTEGTNVLSAALRYKGAVVMPTTVSVKRIVKKSSPSAVTGNAHLWFFGVGVKDYERVDQNLDFADRDANELAKALAFQQGKLYKEVHTKTLTNADATVRDIKIEMNRFFRQASSQDTIILFLAGHGELGSDQELYFMAHDSDINEAYTGLELRAISDFLARRPPGQKALVMMDICHAGGFGGTAKRRGNTLSSDDAVKLVEQGTGTVVLASSTGRESSYEDKTFRGGHGAFTAALLNGLEGKADSQAGDGDGYVFLNELISYVSREVPRLTNGAQHPTTPKMENFRDFPIGKNR